MMYLQVVCGVNKLAKMVAREGSKVFRYSFKNGNEDLGRAGRLQVPILTIINELYHYTGIGQSFVL